MWDIETGQTYPSQLLNENGTISVVAQHYNRKLIQILKSSGVYHNIASVHYLISEKSGLKAAPLKLIRQGWARVQREIAIFAPGTQRILLFADTKSLRVVVPGCPGDVQDTHGTLFSVGEHIIVPTFGVDDWALEHVQPWMLRDIERCIKLTRPAKPLEYGTKFPMMASKLVIDIETTGLDSETDQITVLGLQWKDEERSLITGNVNIDRAITCITEWLWAGVIREVWMHNAQFDSAFFTKDFREAVYGKLHDTMLIAKSRGELVATLKHLGNTYTSRPGNYAWYVPGSPHEFTDPAYVCEDIDTTWRLSKLWAKDVAKPINNLMSRCTLMAVDQTKTGTMIDAQYLDQIVGDTRAFLDHAAIELTEKYGCHPNQTEQLVQNLTDMGYVFSKQTKNGKDSLTADVLEEMGLEDILEYRKAMKLDSAFVGKIKSLLRTNGTLPHHQVMLGAETGRTTMKDFNFQQVPKKGPSKKLIVSRFECGQILQVDLSQAELRIAAYLSNDHAFAAALLRGDMHRENAARAFGISEEEVTDDQRFQAKAVIFRTIYGGRPITDGQKRVYEYAKKAFPDLFRWMTKMQNNSISSKFVTDTYGKTRNLHAVFDYRGKWAVGRAGINSPVQGVASHAALEITLFAWNEMRNAQSHVLFGVHDSTIADVHPQEEEYAIEVFKNAFVNLSDTPIGKFELFSILPLTGDLQIGLNWAALKTAPVIKCSSKGA